MSQPGELGGMLLERDRESGRIGGFLEHARDGHGGALVVEGPAGIGKTALLEAGRDWAEREGFRVLRARGAELEREFAFGVVRQLVEPVLAAVSEPDLARLLKGPPGMATRLLGLSVQDEETAGITLVTPDPSFAVLHGLYWLCANLAVEGPLALMVDDAHWADSASLRFLAFLLPRLDELRVAVLLGVRPAEAGQGQELLSALIVDSAAGVVRVGPLTSGAVDSLLAAGLGMEPEPEFSAACWEATGGTPFLIRTLVDALREECIVPLASSAGKVQEVGAAPLGRWAMLRLARLGPLPTRLARAVAILERADLDQAARLAGLAPSEATSAVNVLLRAGVLGERPALCFAHPLLRGAVYGEIAVAERAEAHSEAARLLADAHASTSRVAEHLLATVPAGDGWVVGQLRTAGREAAARGAPESAAAYLRRALSEPPPPELEGDMLLELGTAELSAGLSGWHDHLEQAVAAARTDTTRIAAALLCATALRIQQRTVEAIEVCDRVASHVGARNTEGHLVLEAMAVLCGLSDTATARSVADRARALLVRARDRSAPGHVLAVGAFSAALANRPADQVAALARRAIGASPRRLPERGEPPWFPIALGALIWAERYDEAEVLLDMAVAEAQATADGMLLPAVLAHRARVALRRGDLTAAEADASFLLDAPSGSPPLMYGLLDTGVQAEALVERGDLEGAERTINAMAGDLPGTSLTAPVLRHGRGRLRLAQRRFGDALADFLAAGEMATHGLAVSPCFLPWRSDAALAALASGEPDTARRLSEEELELSRSFGAPRALGVALRAAGLVAGDPHAETLLREAIEVLAGPDSRLELARTKADLGALLRRRNRRVEARPLLREAMEVAHHLGAEALAGRAETELRATGAKPRRVLLRGLEALTASERRVAELAADGLTNREIAQTLFVTARTVEGHLTSVFQKLDVNTRTALPTALTSPTEAGRT